jgi:Tol biopolymer transport system component
VAGGTPRTVHTIPQRAGPGRMSLSPDGRWLLYAHELSRDQQSRSDIHAIDVARGGARPLVEHPAVDLLVGWLPGTDIVLFSSDRSGTTDLWSVRVVNGRASGAPRLVRSGFLRSQAVGFGDGALFYRVETGSSGPAVINVNPQSGALRGAAAPPVTDLGSAYFRALTWSPDGQTLAAPRRGDGPQAITLHSMQTGDSRVFWLEENLRALVLAWSPDGKALFLRAGEASMVPTGPHHFLRLDLVTGTTTRLFAAADPEEPPPLWRFLVTPDGRSLVLRRQRTLAENRTEMKLVLRSLEDGSERELHRTSGFIPEFSISADGAQLAFMQQAGENSDSLFVMRMDGSQPLRAVASWDHSWDDAVSLLGWLPAGNALLAARLTEEGAGEEILRIDLDGSTTVVGISPFQPRRGARVQGFHRSRLVLSPAGNRLAHLVSDLGEELWRMDGLPALFSP